MKFWNIGYEFEFETCVQTKHWLWLRFRIRQVSIAPHFIIVRDSEAFVFRIPHFQRNNQDEQELETSCCTF